MMHQMRAELTSVDFLHNLHAQETLRKRIVRFLDEIDVDVDVEAFDRQSLVGNKIVQLARYWHIYLVNE